MPNLVPRLFQSREDPRNEVGERLINGICPRLDFCIFLPFKLRYFYLGAQNGKKSSRGIINLSKEDMELFKATKSCFALRFFRFARDPEVCKVFSKM